MAFRSTHFSRSKLKNPYIFVVPMAAMSAASGYSLWKNADLVSGIEHNYLAKVKLVQPSSNSSSTATSIHGKEVTFNETTVPRLIRQDRDRLSDFYRHYSSIPISVSSDDSSTGNDAGLFVHLRSKKKRDDLNNFWLNNVHLNQISIDRYGFEYDDKGQKKSDSTAKVHPIVKWENIEVDRMSNEDVSKTIPNISFRFFNTAIPKSEVEILINSDEAKYQIGGEDENANKDVSLDWFVWMDKSLLALKMNYALQTYVFNQSGAQNETSIKQILGDTGSTNEEQKKKKSLAEVNYKNLPEEYRKFAENYITTFLDTSSQISTVSWSKVINSVTSRESFIKTDDLNKIYNRFKSQEKDVAIFTPHLITKITSGKTGNWQWSLTLDKAKMDLKPENINDVTKMLTNQSYEARDIEALNSSEDSEKRKKNLIYILEDVTNDKAVKMNEILDRVKKYSVRNFSLADNPEFISAVYSSSTDAAQKEAIKLISFRHHNEFGIYMHEKWLPVIMASTFLLGILVYLISVFRGPGAIMGGSVISSAVGAVGSFFFLGSQLSLVGVFAVFVGLFYSLFLSYYLLGFLKKLFDLEFLDPSNMWAVFKRGLVLSTDISLPMFVYSTFTTFLAPDHLREFGIVLSLFVIFSYLFVAVGGCLMAIRRSVESFSKIGNYFRSVKIGEDFYLGACHRACSGGIGWKVATASALGILLLTIILFSALGFNSFSFLRDNALVIAKDSKNANAIEGSLNSLKHVSMSGDDKVYLTSRVDSGALSSLKSDAIVTSTDAFNDVLAMKDVAFAFLCALVLISFYVFIRFKFRNLFILLLNTSLSFVVFVFVFLVGRIFVSSSISIAVCSFFALALLYNISFFGLNVENTIPWYSALVKDIANELHIKIRWTVVWFVAVLGGSGFGSFWMVAIYMGVVAVVSYLSFIFFYQVLSERLSYVKQTYMWKSAAQSESSQHAVEEESLDAYDEELIEGINKRV